MEEEIKTPCEMCAETKKAASEKIKVTFKTIVECLKKKYSEFMEMISACGKNCSTESSNVVDTTEKKEEVPSTEQPQTTEEKKQEG